MAKKKFTLKLSPITGSSTSNLFKMLKGNTIEYKYYPKLILFIIISAFIEPFRWLERRTDKKRIKALQEIEDPVFIVGHWRSGTTFLHNILCQDPQMGYVTTFQAIYPETIFTANWLIKNMMKVMMPKNRAADNMELGTDLPQEEEFALTNTNGLSYYNFWFFPKQWKSYFKKFISFSTSSKEEIEEWKEGYLHMVKKALINTNSKRFISKNPPNSGRIDQLLSMFPNAKFIHIYRDPVTTFVSTKKFIQGTIEPLQFNDISEAELDENIFWTYEKLMTRFEKQKSLIPAENLIEIKFEEFEISTLETIELIYDKLQLPNYKTAESYFENYIDQQEDYQKNEHQIPKKLIAKIEKRWGFNMKRWGYTSKLKTYKSKAVAN